MTRFWRLLVVSLLLLAPASAATDADVTPTTRGALRTHLLRLVGAPLAMDPGRLGIYANPAGTVTSAIVPPHTATVLHLVATPGTLLSDGLAGAEFRIEVTNPAGWFLSFTPPAGGVVRGDPLDTNLDPNSGGGTMIRFSSCKPSSPTGSVHLGTIAVFNNGSGEPTHLLVRRHSSPTDPDRVCPLFVACDPPRYTRHCVGPAAPSAFSDSTVPVALALAEDPVVATLTLGPYAFFPGLARTPYTETIDLHGSELWVMGRKITAPSIQCEFDGSTLRIAGVAVPRAAKPHELSDEDLLRTFGTVPYVAEKMAEGVPIPAAVELFASERRAITYRVVEAIKRGDIHAARRVLRESPLVQSFTMGEEGYSVLYRGLGLWHMTIGDLREWPDGPARPKPLADVTSRYIGPLDSAATRGELIMVASDGVFAWGGKTMLQARAQLGHVLAGGSLASLPRGPLDPQANPLRDVVDAARKEPR